MKKIICLIMSIIFLFGCSIKQDKITTKYFEVTIPESWHELYAYELYEVDDNVYSLIFYDKESQLYSYGGHIFTISIYYEHDEYDYLPSYEYENKISNGEYSYIVITEYPTDVQFDSSTQESYAKLVNTYQQVIDSIEYINGFSVVEE